MADKILSYTFSSADNTLIGSLSFNQNAAEDQQITVEEGLKTTLNFRGKIFTQAISPLTLLFTDTSGGIKTLGLGLQIDTEEFTINGDTFFDKTSNKVQFISYSPQGLSFSPISLPNFSDISRVNLDGSSVSTDTSRLRLTAPTSDRDGVSGSVLLDRQFAISPTTFFNTKFKFVLSEAKGDGFTFVLKNAAVTQTGIAGGYLGYQLDTLATPYNSIAVAFDTHKNLDLDIEAGASATKWDDRSDNEVKLLSNGSVFNSLLTQTNVTDGNDRAAIKLNSGISLTAWVDYDGQTGQLLVFLSKTDVKPLTSLFTFSNLDLVNTVGTNAVVGFTAATGTDRNTQEIQSFEFNYGTKNTNIASFSSPTYNLTGQGERVIGDSRNDIIDATTSFGGNQIFGGTGRNQLFASTNDKLFAGSNGDVLDATVGSGNNILTGGAGNDTLFAGVNDQLIGGAGNDTLFAGRGGSTLTGGDGADVFNLAAGVLPTISPNTITDFTVGSDKFAIVGISGVTGFSNLTLTAQGANTLIAINSGAINLATALNIQPAALTASSFVFI